MRQASLRDIDQLVDLTAEFYAESGFPFDTARATHAFQTLLGDERLGRAWLIQAGTADVGYLVVTLGYSMEYGGVDAFIDELFVRPEYRHAGLGTAAVQEARMFCLGRGVRALHLEVARGNSVAQRMYQGAGFVSNDRQLLTLRLTDSAHAA